MGELTQSGSRAGRFGFVVWNEFQILHFAKLLSRVERPVVFLVTNRAGPDFIQCASLIEDKLHAVVMKVREAELVKFDGLFDGLFSQTNFKGAERFRRTPLFALQYSLTKEAHQYGAWHMDFSAAFCYGEYSARQMAYACTTFPCGHPRLSTGDACIHQELAEQYRAQLDPAKPTLLYAPTWGAGGMVEEFLAEMDWLRERYNVIVRPHHNTMSRELNRIGFVALPERPFLTDDFSTQCSVSDLVVSDYSGVIFDALYLGKPVLLFRDESVAETSQSSFSVDSLEVARKADIGPIAANGEELRGFLEDTTLGFSKPFRERNQRLVEECFVPGSDPAGRILEIADAWRHEPIELPQQRWLRSHVRKKLKAAALEYSKATAKPKRPRTVKTQSGKSTLLQRVRSLYGKFAARVLRKRRLLVPYLRMRSKLKPTSYANEAAKILTNIGEYRAAAEVLAPQVRKSQYVDDAFFRLWIRDPGNQVSVERARDFCASFDCSKMVPAARLRRAICTNDPVETDAIVSEAYDAIASLDPKHIEAGFSALVLLRRYEDIESVVRTRPSLLELASVQRTMKRIAASSESLGGLKKYVAQASGTYNPEQSVDSQLIIYLPPHFFGSNSRKMLTMRARNWEEIRSLYRDVFVALEQDRAPSFRAKHQYFLNLVEAQDDDVPAISFFTKGGGLKNWHMKDAGLGKLVSLDPDGFLGSSMLAKLPVAVIEARLALKEADVSIFERAAALFERHGGDKYRQGDAASVNVEMNDYVFVALQSTKGLEETFQPVEELIRVLADYSRRSGRNVVFKRHPLCEDILITRALAETAKIPTVRIADGDTWQLVEGSSAVVTVNSGVALQAVAALKPLIISGPSEMGVVARRVQRFSEIPSLLAEVETKSSLQRRYAKYLAFYMDSYLIDPSQHFHFAERLRAIVSITKSGASAEQLRQSYFDYLMDRR